MLNQTGFLYLCPVQTAHAHAVTLCCPLTIPVTTATVTVFSCCLDNGGVLHLFCWDKDTDTSERQKGALSFGKEVACIDWPSDLSLFTSMQKNRPYRPRVELEALHYLLSCDLRIIVPISNVWPGSSFHAVVVFAGPCLSSARGVGKGWAVWYVCPRPLSFLIVWWLVCH